MPRRKPHLVVLMADQLAAPFLPAYGHKVVQTPAIDKLAASGVVFERAYTPSPLCAPARAIFMSGRLPSSTGVYDNAAEFRKQIAARHDIARLTRDVMASQHQGVTERDRLSRFPRAAGFVEP